MMWSSPNGNRRGEPPVANNSFSHEYLLPWASTTCFLPSSIAVAVHARRDVTLCWSDLRQIVSTDSPFHSAFERGGRFDGGSDSTPMTPILPSVSMPRIPCTAASPVIPPPMMRYL